MKINIDQTLYVDDDQLIQLADVIDGKESRRKAKRNEVKEFVWQYGGDWATSLKEEHAALFGPSSDTDGTDAHEDLIGGGEAQSDADEDLIGGCPEDLI